MKTAQDSNEHWPTDDTPGNDAPPDVLGLVEVELQLNALGIRGLASANSKEIRQAWRQLTGLFKSNYLRGRRAGFWLGSMVGATALMLIATIGFALA